MITLTREQLEERLAALHKASLELVRDLSLETVLERIVTLAREQAGARYAALGLVNRRGELETFIPVGMSEEEIRKMPHPPKGLGLIGALQRERKIIRIPEISKDNRSVGFPKNHPEMHSFLGVPILSGKRLLGQIYLTDKIDHFEFTEEDEHVIETLAAYAAVAIENAALYHDVLERDRELEQRNRDLSLLNDLARTLASSHEIDEIAEETLSRVIGYLKVEAGEVFLREEGSKILRQILHKGEAKEAFTSRDRFLIGECFVGRVAQIGEVLVSTNLETDVRFLRRPVVEAGFRTLACIPLSARGEVVGAMTVACREKRVFNERELNLLQAIGTWAGTAIENARLHRQAQRLAVLEERERIGMDLHDGIIQSLYGIGLALQYAQLALDEDPKETQRKIQQSIDGLNQAIQDLRAYILDLRPRNLPEDQSLAQGLERLLEEFRTHSTTEVELVTPGQEINSISRENALALFHICQEALANVAKHAQARHATVHLWATEARVLVEIADDGRGFDISKMKTTIGHGLSNMQQRARKVGGEVEISSRPKGGTIILAWVPRQTDND